MTEGLGLEDRRRRILSEEWNMDNYDDDIPFGGTEEEDRIRYPAAWGEEPSRTGLFGGAEDNPPARGLPPLPPAGKGETGAGEGNPRGSYERDSEAMDRDPPDPAALGRYCVRLSEFYDKRGYRNRYHSYVIDTAWECLRLRNGEREGEGDIRPEYTGLLRQIRKRMAQHVTARGGGPEYLRARSLMILIENYHRVGSRVMRNPGARVFSNIPGALPGGGDLNDLANTARNFEAEMKTDDGSRYTDVVGLLMKRIEGFFLAAGGGVSRYTDLKDDSVRRVRWLDEDGITGLERVWLPGLDADGNPTHPDGTVIQVNVRQNTNTGGPGSERRAQDGPVRIPLGDGSTELNISQTTNLGEGLLDRKVTLGTVLKGAAASVVAIIGAIATGWAAGWEHGYRGVPPGEGGDRGLWWVGYWTGRTAGAFLAYFAEAAEGVATYIIYILAAAAVLGVIIMILRWP